MSDDITRSLDLVLKAQEGDQAALNRLIERYYERVRRVVRVRLGPRLRESLDSGDILQETFLAAVRSFQNFEMRDEASLIHWLARLAERQIIAAADYHGAKKRDAGRNVSMTQTRGGSGSITIAFPSDTTGPLDKIAASEEGSAVERCLDELPQEYRELIVLRNYAGASWEVVAEETNRPSAAAARMMYSRAMLELGKLLREKGLR